jgi:tRNA-dihydrouridine synthase
VAQIWGNNPQNFEKAARIAAKLGFDGVDMNMGCPIHEVIKSGCGSGLIGKYELTKEIIEATKKGAGKIPVSVKTRLGIKENMGLTWAEFLLSNNISALTIHARTAKQMSKGDADWDEIGKIVKMRDRVSPGTLIIGNGDVKSYSKVFSLHKMYKVDGVMIGRGIFANPWVFDKDSDSKVHDKDDYIKLLRYHIDLFEKTWREEKNFSVIKKFFKMYVKDFKGANPLRIKLMNSNSFEEVRNILSKI